MIDFYKHLHVSPDADAATIRTALEHSNPSTREAARTILLDPRRRVVYDRNRQVLATIGLLRARLGLNYTRFWSRAAFADFAVELEPIAQDVPRFGRRVDPTAALRAFGSRRRRRHHHRHALWWALLALACIVVLVITWMIVWHVLQT